MFGKVLAITKIEKIFFYIFLFLIPFQIRTILHWGGNEWNSIFLYLGDLLIILIFISAFLRGRIKFKKADLFLLLFLLVAGASLVMASNLGIGVYRFIKLVEFAILFLYIKSNIEFLKLKNIFSVLIFSGLVQSILAIGQFLKQGSLGLKFIEAGIFAPGAPGVATFISNGEKIMRAYGSFPHPNVLAGFLLLAIFASYATLITNHTRMTRILQIVAFFLITFALFLTFSRAALIVFIIVSLAFFLISLLRSRWSFGGQVRVERRKIINLFLVFAFSCLLSTIILFPHLQARFFTISFEEQAIDLRFFYNKMAFVMIKEKPFLGNGIGNFVSYSENYPAYLRAAEKLLEIGEQDVNRGTDAEQSRTNAEGVPSWIYQPVHNIYLLIAVEMGILGLLVFLLFIGIQIVRMSFGLRIVRISNPFFFLLIAFLILGLTDHYFWTLQSGALIFWLSLALLP